MAGLVYNGQDLENRAGFIANGLWNALNDAREWYWWVNTHAAVFASLGITADQALITNAAGDLGGPAGLWSVSHGKLAPSGASDYFSNASQLTGTNYTGSNIS